MANLERIKDFINKKLTLVDGGGEVRLNTAWQHRSVYMAFVYAVEGYGLHEAAVYVHQDPKYASKDTALYDANEILIDYWWENYRDYYDELVEEYGAERVETFDLFTENFDGKVFVLTPEEAAEIVRATDVGKFVDIYGDYD